MKIFKKILAIIISVMTLVCTLPMMSAGAQTVYDELELDVVKKVKISGDSKIFSFVPEKDDWYKFYSTGYGDPYATLYDSDFEMIVESDDTDNDMNFSIVSYLNAGKVYYLEVDAYLYGEASENFNVCVEEAVGVDSIAITRYPDDMTCIRGYEMMSIDFSGLEADFILSDGTVVSWSNDSEIYYINDIEICFEKLKEEDNKYYFVIACGNAKQELVFTVVDNPIEKTELDLSQPLCFYENTNGFINEAGNFYYNVKIPEGSVLKIYNKDGTHETVTDFSYYGGVSIFSDQYNNPWSVGTNYITVSYRGVDTKVPVEILACPIKSVTINSAPQRDYYINDDEWGYTNEVGKYIFTPEDISGLSFTVEYFDGTTETFDDSDIDMNNKTIAGYLYEVKSSYAIKPMTVKATLTFKGYDITYNVDVIESPIRNLEVIWGPDNCFYEERYIPVLDGTKLRITYTDGREKVITLDSSNVHYDAYDYLSGKITDGDLTISFYQVYSEYDEPMLLFQSYGTWAVFDGLYIEENREIKDIEIENFTPDCDDMVVTLTYTDDSSETLHFENISMEQSYNNSYSVVAKTENGLVYLDVYGIVENGEVVSYKLNMFDEKFEFDKVDYEIGDVDMDNVMSIMDATAIALHLAQIDALSEVRLSLADVDNDSVVSIMDATEIQLLLAQMK